VNHDLMRHYYALRRFCPYQGVIQVVDVGNARAYSTDGRHWQIRIQNRDRQAEVPATAGRGPRDAGATTADQFMEVINQRPALPFPLDDRIELWLLRKDTQLPLALIKTRRSLDDIDDVTDPTWRPFLAGDSGFSSRVVDSRQPYPSAPPRRSRAQDALERQVNLAARPLPVLQWFQRLADASGIGHGGLRVSGELKGRCLPADAFPELLVDSQWEKPQEATLVEEYHRWHAAFLLAHQNISPASRAWLESAACERPQQLLANYAMYPEILDKDAMQVALVSAKLIQAS
jgi:hypothetical protein